MKSDKTRVGTQRGSSGFISTVREREGVWLRLARALVPVPELPGLVVRGGVLGRAVIPRAVA